MNDAEAMSKAGELAFEIELPYEPQSLFRMTFTRHWKDRGVPMVNYFATREAAESWGRWLVENERGEAIQIVEYVNALTGKDAG